MARGHCAFSCGYSGYGHGSTPPCWPCGHTWQPDWCVSVRKVWVVLIPLPWRGARRAGWALGVGQSSVPEGVREFPLPPRQASPATPPEEGNSTCHPSGGGEFWAGYSPPLEGCPKGGVVVFAGLSAGTVFIIDHIDRCLNRLHWRGYLRDLERNNHVSISVLLPSR